MLRNFLSTTIISVGIVIAAPALAGPGGGGGGHGGGGGLGVHGGLGAGFGPSMGMPSNAGANARVNSRGALYASPRGIAHSNLRSSLHARSTASVSTRGAHSQSLMHASLTAISRANGHSALARSSVATTALPGLASGLTVKGNGGATIGTVSQIVTGRSDGRIRLVLATSSSGRTIRLAPSTLSISGGVVTTTSM